MLGLQILDVVIGIIFIYLLLSLACSAMNESIAALFKLRAKDLEKGIRSLLTDKRTFKEFCEHPLIKVLVINEAKPSYIPSRNFALALMDIVAPAEGGPDRFNSIRSTVAKFPNGDVRRAMLILVDEAKGDVDAFRENIEDWFNSTMDRVSGTYKRRTQRILLLLGLILTLGLNVNTVTVVKHLAHDSALRDAIVAQAQEIAKQPLPDSTDEQVSLKEPQESLKRIEERIVALQEIGLPIGWSNVQFRMPENFREIWDLILFPWLGWIITAFAVSLGAPFWFDILNKFIVVRSTIKPHEKSPEQHSKDRPTPSTKTETERKDTDKEDSEEPSKD